jgi:hypothetical protein
MNGGLVRPEGRRGISSRSFERGYCWSVKSQITIFFSQYMLNFRCFFFDVVVIYCYLACRSDAVLYCIEMTAMHAHTQLVVVVAVVQLGVQM